jgi:VIT1/CCC1 family predicted Fe2+/Mn2+ transporter
LHDSSQFALTTPAFEHEELALVYVKRGVEPNLARQVADQLMARDALGAHARDELGISEVTTGSGRFGDQFALD